MATTSTVPTVVDAFLTLLNTALPSGVDAFESWPGPAAASEMVLLGEITWDRYEIASLKTGRQRRQEDYAIGFEVRVYGQDGATPDDPSPARDRAFTLFTEIEDLLADNPKLGLSTAIQVAQPHATDARSRTFEDGWAYQIVGRLEVNARLS